MKLNAGVVTGEEYKAFMAEVKHQGYALPAVNVSDTNTVNAALEAAAETRSDIILQVSNGGALCFAGASLANTIEHKILGAVSFARHVQLMAKFYGVCVVLHTDHANESLMPWVEGMIEYSELHLKDTGRPLFSSHMLDLSELPLEENIRHCKLFLERMAPLGLSLEIELGVTGGEEDGVGSDAHLGADNAKLYTQPEEVLAAYKELEPLGHFSVAASFGNVHGVYKPGNVVLRPEILQASQALVQETFATDDKPLDLVFHGGSGSEKDKIVQAIEYGVVKMNIDTDTQFAYSSAVASYVHKTPAAFVHQIDPDTGEPYKKVYDPRKVQRAGQISMKDRIIEAYKDLGSLGKSLVNG